MIFQATSQKMEASGATGTVVAKSGPYKCNTHEEIVVIFKKGAKFTACPHSKGHNTVWSVVRAE
jgi:hypothetical protein